MKPKSGRQLRLGCPVAACRLEPAARARLLPGSQRGTLDRDSRQHTREAIRGSTANLCVATSGAGGSSENLNFVKYHNKYILYHSAPSSC